MENTLEQRNDELNTANLTILMCVRDRSKSLKKLIESLEKIKIIKEKPGILIIIDSRSSLKERNAIIRICEQAKINFLIGEDNIAVNRNLALRTAHTKIVLFIDSDCEVTSDLIISHCKRHKENDECIGVAGSTNFNGQPTLAFQAMVKGGFTTPFKAERQEIVRWAPTANLSLKLSKLPESCFFDKDFKYGLEDVDFGLRITKTGKVILNEPQALINHTTETWSSVLHNIKKVFRWGKSESILMHKHPDERVFDPCKRPIIYGVLLIVSILILGNSNFLFSIINLLTLYILISIFTVGLKLTFHPIGIFAEIYHTGNELGAIIEALRLGYPSLLLFSRRHIGENTNKLAYIKALAFVFSHIVVVTTYLQIK